MTYAIGCATSDETENHTIKLPQEMRKEINDHFDDVKIRIDGVAHITKLLAGNMDGHEGRLESLEVAVAELQEGD